MKRYADKRYANSDESDEWYVGAKEDGTGYIYHGKREALTAIGHLMDIGVTEIDVVACDE